MEKRLVPIKEHSGKDDSVVVIQPFVVKEFKGADMVNYTSDVIKSANFL